MDSVFCGRTIKFISWESILHKFRRIFAWNKENFLKQGKASSYESIFYADNTANFLAVSENEILNHLPTEIAFALVDLQRNAWPFEIRLLKKILTQEISRKSCSNNSILQPGKRIDTPYCCGVLFLHLNSKSAQKNIPGRIWNKSGIMYLTWKTSMKEAGSWL